MTTLMTTRSVRTNARDVADWGIVNAFETACVGGLIK
jgi:hypothetical protein